MGRVPRRIAALLAIVVVLALVVAVARYATTSTEPFDYWLIDDRTLGVIVVSGPRHSCAIARTTEDDDVVRIVAECHGPLLSLGGTAVGIPYQFVVELNAPLGARLVLDGLGNLATRCSVPRCGLPG